MFCLGIARHGLYGIYLEPIDNEVTSLKSPNTIFSSQPTTIFTVMSALATEHQAINLGQGFPDGEGPEDLRAAAARYTLQGPNQYPPMGGMPALRQAWAEHEKRFYDLDVAWQTETLVTSGGTEALTAAFMGLINPGDEAVLIEPVYDSYRPVIEAMGGVCKTVRLHPPLWSLDEGELRAAFSKKTKLIAVNSPMNPIGKVFTREELALIAALCVAYDCYAVCDEVYEHLVFSGVQHIPLITFPGMEERTVKIGSAGKSFSLTGWKVGYITAAAELLAAVAKVHQFLTFTTPPNLQLAVADGLRKDDAYYEELASDLEARRDQLTGGLAAIGFDVLPCDGTYFLTADIAAFARAGESDLDFCKRITRDAGVAAIPLSPFYGDPDTAPHNFIRFCFCKEEGVLAEAVERLKAYTKG